MLLLDVSTRLKKAPSRSRVIRKDTGSQVVGGNEGGSERTLEGARNQDIWISCPNVVPIWLENRLQVLSS